MNNIERAKKFIDEYLPGEFRAKEVTGPLELVPRNCGHIFKTLLDKGFIQRVRMERDLGKHGNYLGTYAVYKKSSPVRTYFNIDKSDPMNIFLMARNSRY